MAVDTGLRNGILLDLVRRSPAARPPSRPAARRPCSRSGGGSGSTRPHARQTRRLALDLFDQLRKLHRLPDTARGLLGAAALLHDVGHAVSPNRHHKHTFYLVSSADLPGFSDRERLLVALIGRYHRRSAPERHRPDLEALPPEEFQTVRRLVALLRVADALDRSHQQPVVSIRAARKNGVTRIAARTRGPIDSSSCGTPPARPRSSARSSGPGSTSSGPAGSAPAQAAWPRPGRPRATRGTIAPAHALARTCAGRRGLGLTRGPG